MTDFLPAGKLPAALLQSLLARYGGRDERLVVGPSLGEDAAAIAMPGRLLVCKSDPITFATVEIGRYVVTVNANDLATMGATPRWFLLTLLLPEGRTDRDLVEHIFASVGEACAALGVSLAGGHTEITVGLQRPLAVGTMLGEVAPERLVRTAGARPGDVILLTKGIALEGTAVLAQEAAGQLAARGITADLLEQGRQLLHRPGISVVRDAQAVCAAGLPHAMHDPTEGGLATALWEMAVAAGHGIEVDLGQVPLLPETAAFCSALGLDPLGLLASGALLVAAAPAEVEPMLAALAGAGIEARRIGRVVDGPPVVRAGPQLSLLPTFARDEVARVLEEAPAEP